MPDAAARARHEAEIRLGLDPGMRYRCARCGNLTRFDVETAERVRRFWHFDLAGDATAEEEEIRELDVVEVRCRWCDSGDGVEVEPAPDADPPTTAES